MAGWRAALDGFVDEIKSVYGTRLDAIVLYGSRARGDEEESSDVDTLVVLDRVDDLWRELQAIGKVASRHSLEHDVVISAIPADARRFRLEQSPLLLNIRREGVRVA